MSDDGRRLYGQPGAEELWFDPADAVQNFLDCRDEDGPLDFMLEEWSVHSPRHHLPSVSWLLDWIDEWVCENGEVTDGFEMPRESEMQAAAEAFLDAIASKIKWRMANEKLRDLHVTGDEENPLIDGAPVFVPAPGNA